MVLQHIIDYSKSTALERLLSCVDECRALHNMSSVFDDIRFVYSYLEVSYSTSPEKMVFFAWVFSHQLFGKCSLEDSLRAYEEKFDNKMTATTMSNMRQTYNRIKTEIWTIEKGISHHDERLNEISSLMDEFSQKVFQDCNDM